MYYQEKHLLTFYPVGDGIKAVLKLNAPAIPQTVQIYQDTTEIIPTGFDEYGNPYFTGKSAMFHYNSSNLIQRNTKTYQSEKREYIFDVTYENAEIPAPTNTLREIELSTRGIKLFLQTALRRENAFKACKQPIKLDCFVLWGRIVLTSTGSVGIIEKPKHVHDLPPVLAMSTYKIILGMEEEPSYFIAKLPMETDKCPCCNKKFTLIDIKEGNFSSNNGEIWHKKCQLKFERRANICELCEIIDENYTPIAPYRLVNNELDNTPWMIFETEHGDIKIGRINELIYIEWQENYLPFPMSIFNHTYTTKKIGENEYDGDAPVEQSKEPIIRGIYACSIKEACMYIYRAKEAAT